MFNRRTGLWPTLISRQRLGLWLLIGFALIPLPVFATCRLPIPDGGDETYVPSRENLFGNIERVELPYVFVNNGKTQRLEKVSVSKISEIYTVYGGFVPLSELKPKLQVWVWFENCERPIEGIPNVAYFQIFSTSSADRAKLDSDGKVISVPPR